MSVIGNAKARAGKVPAVRRTLYPAWDRYRFGRLGRYVSLSRRIPGWAAGDEGVELIYATRSLPPDAQVLVVGVFLGRAVVLMAGGLEDGNGGTVHCIDPFDGSGEDFSAPIYKAMLAEQPKPARARFEEYLRSAGLTDRVVTHEGMGEDFAPSWSTPLDMLFLSADQSPEGARRLFEAFTPHVRPGGIVVVHNSEPGHVPGHDGNQLVAEHCVVPPEWVHKHRVRSMTFARRAS